MTNDADALVHTKQRGRLNLEYGQEAQQKHIVCIAVSNLMHLCTSGCLQFQEGTKYLHYSCFASGGGFGGSPYRNGLNLVLEHSELVSTWLLCPYKSLSGSTYQRFKELAEFLT